MSKIHPLWEEYIIWLHTPAHERGDAKTEAQWAEKHGFKDARTTRLWKSKDAFKEFEAELLSRMSKNSTGESAQLGDVDFSDERDYRLVKTQLLAQAKSGNLKATEMFMKLYGKTWIEDEQASRASDYSTQDLEKLVATAVAALSPELLAGALEASGWTVIAPGHQTSQEAL